MRSGWKRKGEKEFEEESEAVRAAEAEQSVFESDGARPKEMARGIG